MKAVNLPKELQEFVDESVKSGRFLAETEVVIEALESLKVREDFRDFQLAQLKEKLQAGLDQVQRGDAVPWDLNTFKARCRAWLAREQALV